MRRDGGALVAGSLGERAPTQVLRDPTGVGEGEDTCHVVTDAPEVQVHEVGQVGVDEHLVVLRLGDGVPGEAERAQALEPPQVDELGRRGRSVLAAWKHTPAFSLQPGGPWHLQASGRAGGGAQVQSGWVGVQACR